MNPAAWARRGVVCGGLAVLAGCAQKGPAPLYLWESFPRQQYETLLRSGAGSAEQIAALEAHAERARGAGAALPPGFRAHLGMLKLSVGDADRARELWQAEKAAFPESAPYMDRLLKQLQAPATTEKPA
jgi:hypothetical protein